MINTDFNNIHLKYSNDNWATETVQELNPVRDVEFPITERITGSSLRAVMYSHRVYTRTGRTITISADELATTAKMDFIIAFYKAAAWAYSQDGTNWTMVVLEENGRFDPTYIEDWVKLPEVTFTLINKEAD